MLLVIFSLVKGGLEFKYLMGWMLSILLVDGIVVFISFA
jgi:hypothetical protein